MEECVEMNWDQNVFSVGTILGCSKILETKTSTNIFVFVVCFMFLTIYWPFNRFNRWLHFKLYLYEKLQSFFWHTDDSGSDYKACSEKQARKQARNSAVLTVTAVSYNCVALEFQSCLSWHKRHRYKEGKSHGLSSCPVSIFNTGKKRNHVLVSLKIVLWRRNKCSLIITLDLRFHLTL